MTMWSRAFAVVLALSAGCLAQVQAALNPTPVGGGTLTCRQIVEQCDVTCGDPMCVRRCGDQGTPDAAQQHAAVVDCAERYACTDLDCIRANCPGESSTCEGPAQRQAAPPQQPPS